MKGNNHSNALLMELLIVVLFFMLAATMLLQTFAASRRLSDRAGLIGRALTEAQNVAEQLYAAQDTGAVLARFGLQEQDGAWQRDNGEWVIRVTSGTEDAARGTMTRAEISVTAGEDLLFTLPVARYREAQP